MGEEFGTRPEALYTAIGPSIGVCCYEVDEPVAKEFLALTHLQPEKFVFAKEGGKYQLDLWECNRQVMAAAGVPESHISVGGVCTQCHSDLLFFPPGNRRKARRSGRRFWKSKRKEGRRKWSLKPVPSAPRNCRVRREETEGKGFCRMGALPVVARAALHQWEEPAISGTGAAARCFLPAVRCNACSAELQHQHPPGGGKSGHTPGAPRHFPAAY